MEPHSPCPLEHFLDRNNCFESSHDTEQRLRIVQEVEAVFQDWLKSKVSSDQANGLLLLLGSVKLKTHAPRADTDILLVVSAPISRSDCFTGFYHRHLQDGAGKISWSRKIENTFIPVMKTRYQGTDLDIAVAQLPCNAAKADLMNDKILRLMDIQSVRSLNGYRDTVIILNMLDKARKTAQFRIVLTAIKLWATRRGLYNNSVGYFSGMGLMVLVARVILRNLMVQGPFQYLKIFFDTYSTWPWPRPVQLAYNEANDCEAPVLQVWNPLECPFYKDDRMPIITPAYPQRNSAFTVTTATREVIKTELRRGADELREGTALETLFSPSTFFTSLEFSHYVVLRAATSSLSQHEHLDWCAIARSQIRKFLGRTGDHSAISRVHAWPNAYAVTGPTVMRDSKYMESQWFIGMDFNCNEKDFIADHIKKFEENVITYAVDHNLGQTNCAVSGFLTAKDDLYQFLPHGIGSGVAGYTSLQEVRKGFFMHEESL